MPPNAPGAAQAPPQFSLPLFPLRTVLFPGGLLPLKIFEQRYVEMAKACLRDGAPFGVCMITRGDEVAHAPGEMPEIAGLGTLASLREWDMPQLGILQVVAEGGARFRIHAYRAERNGLVVGDVSAVDAEPSVALRDDDRPLAALLEQIVERAGPKNFPAGHAFDDASWVGHRLAEVLPLPLAVKQELLESDDAQMRLGVLRTFIADYGLL